MGIAPRKSGRETVEQQGKYPFHIVDHNVEVGKVFGQCTCLYCNYHIYSRLVYFRTFYLFWYETLRLTSIELVTYLSPLKYLCRQ